MPAPGTHAHTQVGRRAARQYRCRLASRQAPDRRGLLAVCGLRLLSDRGGTPDHPRPSSSISSHSTASSGLIYIGRRSSFVFVRPPSSFVFAPSRQDESRDRYREQRLRRVAPRSSAAAATTARGRARCEIVGGGRRPTTGIGRWPWKLTWESCSTSTLRPSSIAGMSTRRWPRWCPSPTSDTCRRSRVRWGASVRR